MTRSEFKVRALMTLLGLSRGEAVSRLELQGWNYQKALAAV